MQEEKPLKEVLEEMLRHYRLKGKYQQAKIRSHWGTLMGPMIEKYTRGLQVHRRRLIVEVDSAALRQELSMSREKIRDLMNEALGEEYLRDVLIR
jgi:predicted nucleic acid-binding Zn ribbon protein